MAKGIVVLRTDICKACELCVSVCPKGCLELDKKNVNAKAYHPVVFINQEECIACANCALICPDGVINVYKED